MDGRWGRHRLVAQGARGNRTTEMNLWKVAHQAYAPLSDPASGQIYSIGRYAQQHWDLRNDHTTYSFGATERGRDIVINGAVPTEYDDINRYSTAAGLFRIAIG